MPRFHFDLFFGRYVVLDPGGTLLDHETEARVAAERLARHLALVCPELRKGRGWIRVRDAERNELHRLPIDADFPADVSLVQVSPVRQ